MKKQALVGLIVGALMVTQLSGVAAAAPTNDNRADATVVASLPFLENINTSEATIEANDHNCWEDEVVNATVWYSFTPATDGTYGVTSVGSSYPTEMEVGIPTADGGFEYRRCSESGQGDPGFSSHGFWWYGRAGQPYLIMVGAYGQGGGDLALQITQNPATVRFPTFTIAATGQVMRQGYARIAGRLVCRNLEGRLDMFVNVKQRLPSQPKVDAYSARAKATCGQAWTAVAASGRDFRSGQATAHATVRACNDWGCDQADVTRTIRLIE